MNKKKLISFFVVIFIILCITIFTNTVIANQNVAKRNANSYWSKSNAPILYGANKITIPVGELSEFNVLDTRFRVFAKDFEDGDITQNVEYSGHIDTNNIGNYTITYKVKDSHNNESVMEVPVIVTNDNDSKINVERTVYTIPSVWNMDLAGFSRCNYGDRQILGVYMPSGTNIKARILSADENCCLKNKAKC